MHNPEAEKDWDSETLSQLDTVTWQILTHKRGLSVDGNVTRLMAEILYPTPGYRLKWRYNPVMDYYVVIKIPLLKII